MKTKKEETLLLFTEWCIVNKVSTVNINGVYTAYSYQNVIYYNLDTLYDYWKKLVNK